VAPEASLKDVAAVLVEHAISGMPVCDGDGRILGIVSEADILYKRAGDGLAPTVHASSPMGRGTAAQWHTFTH